MFGFGRPSKEKAVINSFALQLTEIGLPESDAVRNATNLVDEVLGDFKSRGIDPYKSTQGTEYASKEAFVAPRIAAGLTIDDIKFHWNRPLIIIFCEMKLRELINFIVVDVANQQGKDLVAAGSQYKKTFVRYGDPSKWDPKDKFNVELTEADSDIYPEFANRVDTWRRKTSDKDVDDLIGVYGTLNAAIRMLIEIKSL